MLIIFDFFHVSSFIAKTLLWSVSVCADDEQIPSQLMYVVRDTNKIWLFSCSGMLSVFDSRCVIFFKCSFVFIFGRLKNCRAAMGTVVASVMVACLPCTKIVILE